MKKKTELNGYIHKFSVDYNIVDTSDIVNTDKYLIKNYYRKYCLELCKIIYCIIS